MRRRESVFFFFFRGVFIHGDFWHGRDPQRQVKSNVAYWNAKISGNIARDKQQRRILKKAGWAILTVWESDIMRKRTREESLAKIEGFLRG